MKEYIKNIIAESLKDEVDVDREWERLFSSIEKMTLQNDVLLTRLIDFCIIFFQETR